MRNKIFVWLLATVLLATVSPAQAQQPGKTPRIGFLLAVPASTISTRIEADRVIR